MAVNDHSLRGHAELSGSTASRWLKCTMSILHARSLPKQAPSEASLMGTERHEKAEHELDKFLDFLRDGPKKGKKPYNYLAIEDEHVAEAIKQLYEIVLEEKISEKFIKQEVKLFVSEKFKMYGSADVVIVYIDSRGKRCGIIVDYKFGHYEVLAKGNSQLPFYGVGLLNFVRSLNKDLDYVRTIIIQPTQDEVLKEVSYTADQLEKWNKKFLDVAYQVYVKKNFKYKVGEWCKFCPAIAVCPKYVKETEKNMQMSLIQPKKPQLVDPETLDIQTIEKLVHHGQQFKDFLKRCEELLLAKLRTGYKGSYLKVVQGQTRRTFNKDTEEVKRYLKLLGVKRIVHEELLGIGEIEKQLIMKHAKVGVTKKKTTEKVRALLKAVVNQSNPVPSLVSVKDPRPALATAADMFSDEEMEDVEFG